MDAAVENEALIVIGTIESELTWNLIDYSAPLKIGVAQWHDSTAASLLSNLPTADKNELAQTILDDLNNHQPTDPFWQTRYLTKDEGNTVVTALGSSSAESFQRNFFSSTINDYASVMTSWGCVPDGTLAQRKTFIFLTAVFHVNITAAGAIVAAIGAETTTQVIYDAIMNKPEISGVRDWSRVKALVDNWDGGLDPVQGSTDDVWEDPGGPGDGGTIIHQVESQIQKIGQTGQQLIIYGKDNPDGVVCYRATNNLWYPTSNTAAPDTPTPIVPEPSDTPATSSEFEAMRQLWYDNEGRFSYGWGPGRLDPESSGFTDCSGCIWWAVNKIRPDLAQALGDYTTPQSHAGELVVQGNLADLVTFDSSILKEGDIVLVSKSGNYSANGDSHVEWYFGNDTLWGAGYAPLPHFSSSSVFQYLKAVSDRYTTYMIRRFL